VLDTNPRATRRYYELLRQQSGARRLAMAAMLTSSVRQLAEAGIRAQYPGLTERQVRARLAQRLYGTVTARRLFGLDLDP